MLKYFFCRFFSFTCIIRGSSAYIFYRNFTSKTFNVIKPFRQISKTGILSGYMKLCSQLLILFSYIYVCLNTQKQYNFLIREVVKTRTNCPYAATFFGYIFHQPAYIYIYLYKYIYTYIFTCSTLQFYDNLFILDAMNEKNMDFLKKFKTKILIS